MVKVVNVYPKQAITTTNPPIRTRINRIHMDVKDIRKCIIAGAYVEEVLGDQKIRLNFSNYDKINQIPTNIDTEHPHTEAFKEKVAAKEEVKKEEKKPVDNNKQVVNKPVSNNGKKFVKPEVKEIDKSNKDK